MSRRIFLVAAESSGDALGADLSRALRERDASIELHGVGGPLMQAEGLTSYFPMERLSVMGLVEVLGRELSLAVAGEKTPADALAAVEVEFAELAKKDGKLK